MLGAKGRMTTTQSAAHQSTCRVAALTPFIHLRTAHVKADTATPSHNVLMTASKTFGAKVNVMALSLLCQQTFDLLEFLGRQILVPKQVQNQ